MPLDDIDRKILAELQLDSGRTAKDIAALVGISQSAYANRASKLKQDKYILRTTAIIDPDRFDLSVLGFVLVRFSKTDHSAKETFVDKTKEIGNVMEIHRIFGEFDALVKLRAKNNGELLKKVERLQQSTGTITETIIVASSPLDDNIISTAEKK